MLGISVLTVYSFIPILVKTEGGSPGGYLVKHVMYCLLGFLIMFFVHKKNPSMVAKLSSFMFFIAILLLVFTFFFGATVNQATRWVRVPVIGLTFQTSDFAKLALVIYLSRLLVLKEKHFESWKKGFMPMLFPVLLVTGFIAFDNLSTAVLIFLISFLLLYIGRVPITKLLTSIMIGVGGLGILVLIHFSFPSLEFLPRLDTWYSRFTKAYGENIDTVSNAQAINAELAIHNGGYFGVGVGDGELKQYLPEAYADFYFSSFIEELGLFSGIFLIFLYLVLFHRIVRIGLNAAKPFETYVCIGIGLIIITQALVNMLVCTGLIPVTGQNMPLLAMGGSAMIMTCLGIGIVQSIAKKNNDLKKSNSISKTAKA